MIIALTGMVSGQAEFKADCVRICVNVQSNIYTYKVTNLSTSPIVRFEVKQHVSYNFIVPEGWQHEISSGVLQAWTSNRQMAIQPDRTAEFSLRVSSRGAVLGRTPAKVQFQSGETITVPGVWAPTPEPRSYIALVVGLVLILLLLHTTALVYKSRRAKKASINDA